MPQYHLDAGEQIIQRVNRHWANLIPVVVSSFLVACVTVAGLVGYIMFARAYLPAVPVLALAIGLFAIAFLMLYSARIVYRNNYLLITNMHVIKVEQAGLFAQHMAQLSLARIEDVKGSRQGVLGTMFDFGDIEIQTAGTQENFIFSTVPSPQILADGLLEKHEQFLKNNPNRELP
jgi:hypothetical protein